MSTVPESTLESEAGRQRPGHGQGGGLPDARVRHPNLVEALAADTGPLMRPQRAEASDDIRSELGKYPNVPKTRDRLKHLRAGRGNDRGSQCSLHPPLPRCHGQRACQIAGRCAPRDLGLDV